jgi:hypothetical protein
MSRNACSPVFRSRVLIAVSALVLGGGALAVQPATGSLAAKQSLKKARCHPSYKGACLDPKAYDYDCRGGRGNGPKYTGIVRVVGPDVFRLDADHDGWGCE